MAQTPLSTRSPARYKHIVNAGTVVVSAKPNVLFGVNVNAIAAASTGTLYDAATAAAVTGSLAVGILSFGSTYAAPTWIQVGPSDAGIQLNSGLVIISTGSIDATIVTKS